MKCKQCQHRIINDKLIPICSKSGQPLLTSLKNTLKCPIKNKK